MVRIYYQSIFKGMFCKNQLLNYLHCFNIQSHCFTQSVSQITLIMQYYTLSQKQSYQIYSDPFPKIEDFQQNFHFSHFPIALIQQKKFLGYNFYCMNQKSNIWLDSPFIKPICLYNPPIIKQDLQNDPQELILRPQMQIQETTPSIFKFHTHPLSPWSSCINPNNDRFSSQKRPALNYQVENHINQQIEQRIMVYSDVDEDQPATPIRQNHNEQDNQDSLVQTTGKKSIIDKGNIKRKSRPKEKGLRQLSQKVYRIIQILEQGTYKEVAAELINQLNKEIHIDEKQQQNIKRRVYDSLNVLVSLGVLVKEGHIISCTKNIHIKRHIQQKMVQIGEMSHELLQRQAKLKKKQDKLKQTQQKYQLLSTFISRNRCMNQKQQRIQFPYIGIIYNDNQISKKIQQKQEVYMESSKPFVMFGDVDSVKWLCQVPKY